MSIPEIIFFSAAVVLAIVSFVCLVKDSRRIHGTIRNIRGRAEKANNAQELIKLRGELQCFANKNCGLRQYMSHAREVLSYIDGRLDGYSN